MHRYFQRWLVAILFVFMVFVTSGPAYAATTSNTVAANKVHAAAADAAVFPPCNATVNASKIIVVGGKRYQCICDRINKSQPCNWVWKNLDAAEAYFTLLQMDHGVAISAGPKATLYFQPDNNLVVYDETGTARWASHTVGKGAVAMFQADGNFVVYNGSNQATWASNTCCHYNTNVLNVQADGNVVIYDAGIPVWSTHTNH